MIMEFNVHNSKRNINNKFLELNGPHFYLKRSLFLLPKEEEN